jgi:methionine-rich copper-binding protein CopC
MTTRWRWLAAVTALVAMLATPATGFAHAEPVSSFPPIGGGVMKPPTVVEIVFSEEIADGTTAAVFDAQGTVASAGAAVIDLEDVARITLRVPLEPNLAPGTYTVRWTSQSAADGDSDSGEYTFVIGEDLPAAATSAVATPVASPVAGDAAAAASPTLTFYQQRDQMLAKPNDDYDARGFGISVLVGIAFAIGIYFFWRKVRPKPGERVR